MGKIRTKIIGSEEVEKEQAIKAEARREAKKLRRADEESAEVSQASKETKTGQVKVKAPGTKGGERTVSVDMDEENLQKMRKAEESIKSESSESKKEAKTRRRTKTIGKKHVMAKREIDKNKKYSLTEAVALVRKTSYAKFDETIELHLNLNNMGIKGEVVFPHAVGKELNVRIVDDAVLADIEKGKLDFDVLIARPSDMAKLVPYAKVLGPKGLMPNPKNGTVSDEPEKAADKLKKGALRYKSEAKFPLLHQAVGKLSFKDEAIVENSEALLKAISTKNIDSAFMKSSMGPSVSLEMS